MTPGKAIWVAVVGALTATATVAIFLFASTAEPGDRGGSGGCGPTTVPAVGTASGGVDTAAAAALAAGWAGEDAVTAVAVAGAESGYDPLAANTGSTARGMWQIMLSYHEPKFAGADWRDPYANARVAHMLWEQSGWQPWVAYTSGAYLVHMTDARAAVTAATGGGITNASFGSCATAVAVGDVIYPVDPTTDSHNYGGSGALWSRSHTGTDFSIACGTPVRAAHSGTVTVDMGQPWSGRWLVKVATGPRNLTTWYAHMQSVTVTDGQRVTAGTVLGQVGAEGNATGCHLHFEVHPHGGGIYEDGVDPSPWLADHAGQDAAPVTVPVGAVTGGADVTVLTANVPFTLSESTYRGRVVELLDVGADVVIVQEASGRDAAPWVAAAPGWAVLQGAGGSKAAGPIFYNATRFAATGAGQVLGFNGPGYDRYLTWATFRSSTAAFAVVNTHMPTKKDDGPGRPYYHRMTAAYQGLVRSLERAGYPVLIGGDWNAPLDKVRAPVEPVAQLARVGMTTNWRYGNACAGGSSGRGGKIDGFGVNPDRVTLLGHGCLPRDVSDHRPVWIRVRLR